MSKSANKQAMYSSNRHLAVKKLDTMAVNSVKYTKDPQHCKLIATTSTTRPRQMEVMEFELQPCVDRGNDFLRHSIYIVDCIVHIMRINWHVFMAHRATYKLVTAHSAWATWFITSESSFISLIIRDCSVGYIVEKSTRLIDVIATVSTRLKLKLHHFHLLWTCCRSCCN